MSEAGNNPQREPVRQAFEGRVEWWLDRNECETLCVELPQGINYASGDRVRVTVERIET